MGHFEIVRNFILAASVCRGAYTVPDWGMLQFTIVLRGRAYWVEAIQEDGTRRPVERYDTEDAAVSGLRMLPKNGGIEQLEPQRFKQERP